MPLTASEHRLVDSAASWFDANRERFVKELCDLIRYPSVAAESDPSPKPGEPYGHEVRRVFDHMIDKAACDGFHARDYDGHVLEVAYPQDDVETDDDIAFVGHLDVVPAGPGWTHDAFEPRVVGDGDIVIGRGALDDKGVSLVNYNLLRFFNERGHCFRHRVRMLFGGSEEPALNDIKWFVRNVGAPHQAIVTDGPFPVNNIQKGLLDVDVALPVSERLRGWHAGSSANTIPAVASIDLSGMDVDEVRQALEHCDLDDDTRRRITITPSDDADGVDNGGVTVTAHGISGHASKPDGTINAIALLTSVLAKSGLLDGRDAAAAEAIAAWAGDPYGGTLGFAFDNTESGPTTSNLGIVMPGPEFGTDTEGRAVPSDAIVMHLDIRYAVGQTDEDILAAIRRHVKPLDGRLVNVLNDDPYYVPDGDSRVELLTGAYNDVINGMAPDTPQARPVAMGGGTHARFIPDALNFGPEFHAEYVPSVDGIVMDPPDCIAPGTGSAHGIDEWVSIRNLRAAFVMYALGLVRLDQYLDGRD
ncbi:Sapep family Mn(2+)-dependent dipeptidase [Bifidobacterium sp. SMB2]|uniref:Sapep family Mn(2+)-dependent dipeptidase n=1 Tax=Bifidobacterium saimiriisciurei TaxID=2661627 RepID=A0ABX0C805_9BIFI|nr:MULTISPECIES: Sapep family Mn(2+)-dependent dipeptidase [Bifidobacterium]NEG96182.1 Sapep family Mn(2+)-dependent dipeptidase [Bifidobacterium sp. SMB2]NEH10740.1 Sapep family Mn(2+)-dependent dipeptidase [Bifidobacterium saimiriisciurei]